jgi:uncharacterized protein
MKKALLILFTYVFTSAWTVTLMERPGSAELAQGMMQRDQKQYEQAATSFQTAQKLARDNETLARAKAELGSMYMKQQVPAPAPDAGLKLLEQAVQLGSPEAILTLGDMYRKGFSVTADQDKAAGYYQQVADRYPDALLSLAEIYAGQPESLQYFDRARAMAEANPQGTSGAALRIAQHYMTGTLVAADAEKAEQWLYKAVRAGNVNAAVELAEFWQINGHEPKTDIIKMWEQAASHGNGEAYAKLGYSYDVGWVVERNPQKAQEMFEKAVEADPSQDYQIARLYENVYRANPQNTYYQQKNLEWYQRASDRGHPEATLRLARAYWRGDGKAQNRTVARDLYNKAIAAGNPKAQDELAKYEHEERVRFARAMEKERRHREEEARRIANRAKNGNGGNGGSSKRDLAYWSAQAKRGNPEAMREVGTAQLNGNGMTKDVEAGVNLLKKAADAGDIPAMLRLAQTYASGSDVAMDVREAYRWYGRAANAGSPEGQYQLGLGYARGLGVDKDEEKAKVWLKKASANGYSIADSVLESLALTGSDTINN